MHISLPDFSTARVLVVGDVMLDRYWHGDTGRISPEAPVPVVRVGQIEERPGGAANVAFNIGALEGSSVLLALTGDDEAADRLQHSLAGARVDCRFQRQPGVPTITKLRVISRHQQLIRLDFESPLDGVDRRGFDAAFDAALAEVDVVILSDYAKGTLRDPASLIARARRAGRRVLVDPKHKDFSVYRGATLLTPNFGEFEAAAGPCPDEETLEHKARQLLRDCELEALLVTRGEQGMSLFRIDAPALHLATQAREVFDVTGAGDTVISVLAAALAAGAEMPVATALANLGAGIVVGKLGTATVSIPELRRALHGLDQAAQIPMSEARLKVLVGDARAHGERIVFTNGCFDILHAGHVAYLQQARKLGDRLIVAVNDDASVAALKGPTRPVNPLAQRMAVLAGLAAVDWVVPFSEDTPERLIRELLPDVLVKGGDYRPEQIAGADAVQANGGEVVVLDFLDGCSTSAIVKRIREAEA